MISTIIQMPRAKAAYLATILATTVLQHLKLVALFALLVILELSWVVNASARMETMMVEYPSVNPAHIPA